MTKPQRDMKERKNVILFFESLQLSKVKCKQSE